MNSMTEIGKKNGVYLAKIIAERKTGDQNNWEQYLGHAWDYILLFEQTGFLDQNKFWGLQQLNK